MNKRQDNGWKFGQPLRTEAEFVGVARTGESLSGQLGDAPLREFRLRQIDMERQQETPRRAYGALEIACNRYLPFYDFAPIGYLSLTAQGLVVDANLTCAKLLGKARKELMNRHFADYIAPEDRDRWWRHFPRLKQLDGTPSFELTLLRADGELFAARIDCLDLNANDAAPALRIALTDITERKRADESLRIAAAAFETQDGILVTGADKTVLRVNQAFSRITGYSAEEAIGRPPFFLRSEVHDADFYQSLWAATASAGYWQGEIWDQRKNGETFPLMLTLTAITGADGGISHYVGAFTDITAQKQAEKVLLKARRRLENKVATTQAELEKLKQESSEINAALNILLKHRQTDKSDAQNALAREMEGTVLPFLKKLKKTNADRHQTRLIEILERNLQHLVKCYGHAANLPTAYQRLTPVEAQVASMVRQGLPTKLIAATLNLSPGTIDIHRKHIRKKLGLAGKTANLQRYLMSLAE